MSTLTSRREAATFRAGRMPPRTMADDGDLRQSRGGAARAGLQRSDEADALNALMHRYAAGDDAVFRALYDGLYPRVRGFLLRLTGSPSLALDLSQETFLRLYRARGTFGAGLAVIPWVYAIARNCYRDHLRRAAVSRPDELHGQPEPELLAHQPAAGDSSGEEVLVAREANEVIRRTLAALPSIQREAFVLLRFEELSVAEAAEVLETTQTSVKLRKFRAQEAILRALAEWRAR